MTAKDAILYSLGSTKNILEMYLADLSDADLFVRTSPNANHIAWQLGQVIWAEVKMIKEQVPSAEYPRLPADFQAAHDTKAAAKDGPEGFLTKAEYLDLFGKVRGATMAALKGQPETELDRPSEGQMASYAPKVGDMFLLVSNHTLMHAGQITPVRRKLGKPILF